MRTGPKALVGLGLPAALRPHTPDKGVGALVLGALVLRDRATNQPLTSRATGQYLTSRSA